MTEYKNKNNSFAVELFIDGESKGIFPTLKKAKEYEKSIELSSESDTVEDEAIIDSGIADQKTDETPVKRRGRPRKVGKDDGTSTI